MALGNLKKKEWAQIRTLQEKARGQLDDFKALAESTVVGSKRDLDNHIQDLSDAYKALRTTVVELSSLFVNHYETQNDLYQEKLDNSERWGDSERASQVDSWVSALETLANPEEIPEDLTLDMEAVSFTVTKRDSEGEYEDDEYGAFPTTFPTKVDLSSAADVYAVESYVDDVEALDEDGASVF